ncbi:MAG: hypothetical protein ABI972_22420 [Acidobacteriota bacterium]
MPSQGLTGAVGRRPAPNRQADQELVTDLLLRVPDEDGGADSLPGAGPGPNASFELINAIVRFQSVMASRSLMSRTFVDGRVDTFGKTIKLLERFAQSRRGGGGLIIPIDPPTPVPPAPPAKKGPGFLGSLFQKLQARATNLQIAGGSSFSASLLEFGSITGDLDIANRNNVGSVTRIGFAGAGLSLGPLPFGVEIAPSDMPSVGSRISAGPRTEGTTLTIDDLLGFSLMIGISAGPGGGGNATAILFNIGRNRSLKTAAQDILNAINPNAATSFVIDAFNTCKAFGTTAGIFSGLSVGVSLMEVLVDRASGPPNILPDPDVRNRLISTG